MADTITHIGKGTLVQHGKHNDRVYLLKLLEEDTSSIADKLINLAEKYNYSKIFCKIPKKASPLFWASGYLFEGYIPGFYKGREDAFFVSKFLKSRRLNKVPSVLLKKLHPYLSIPTAKQSAIKIAEGYSFKRLKVADIPMITKIYSDTFATYPFPIYDADYIRETMEKEVQYFGAFKNGRLAAIASSEIDMSAKNAEMTDFATYHIHTGNRLAYWLLVLMEKEMKKLGIITLYTIVRLKSIPMNKTFIQSGYEFSGVLINNTNISGDVETMTLYHKKLL